MNPSALWDFIGTTFRMIISLFALRLCVFLRTCPVQVFWIPIAGHSHILPLARATIADEVRVLPDSLQHILANIYELIPRLRTGSSVMGGLSNQFPVRF